VPLHGVTLLLLLLLWTLTGASHAQLLECRGAQ
jgi:hypothetical protein